ncbi:unnamed protein product [Discula destructiva]
MGRRLPEYTIPPPMPAIPETSLRGAISSTVENGMLCSPFSEDGVWPHIHPSHLGPARGQQSSVQQSMPSHHVEAIPYMDLSNVHCSSAMPMGTQNSVLSLMTESPNSDYPFDHRLLVTSQFDMCANSPNHYGMGYPFPAMWDHGTQPGVGHSITFPDTGLCGQFEPMSTTPAISHFEPMMEDYTARHGHWKPGTPASPSQASSIAGPLSGGGMFMDMSRQSSMTCLSPSPMANRFERPAQPRDSADPALAQASAATTADTPADGVPRVGKGVRKSKTATFTGPKDKCRRKTTAGIVKILDTSFNHPIPTTSTTSASASSKISPVTPEGAASPEVPEALQSSQRQRSRRAATKCREKTKKATAELEATEKAITAENLELTKTVKDLRGEVLALKNQLLLHGNCDCDIIQRYLRKAAHAIGSAGSKSDLS